MIVSAAADAAAFAVAVVTAVIVGDDPLERIIDDRRVVVFGSSSFVYVAQA